MTYIVDFYFGLCFNRTWVVKMIKILEDLERKMALGNITGNLGKAIEYDNMIVCYVGKKSLNKDLFLFNYNSGKNTRIAKKYDLDKEIFYVFDGLEITHDIYGFDNVSVLFRNCKFFANRFVKVDGYLKIKNSNIETVLSMFLVADNILIDGLDIPNLGIRKISFGARDVLNINDLTIGDKFNFLKNSNVSFSGKNVSLNNTNVNALDISINGDNLSISNSKLDGNAVLVKGNLINNVSNIEEKIFDESILTCDDELINKRKELVKILGQINNVCQDMSLKRILK